MEDNKKLNKFERLIVWQKAHQFVLSIYQITKKFPKEEKYLLVDQLRRSASSISANIVEGNEKKSRKEYLQFLYTAKGSLAETKYHLLLAKDLYYLDSRTYSQLQKEADEIGKLLIGLIRYLQSSISHLPSLIFHLPSSKSITRSSFTLLELTIVIALLALLAAATLWLLNPWQQIAKAQDARRKHDLDTLRKVLEDYYNDHSCYPRPDQICYQKPVPTPAGFSNICTGVGGYQISRWQTCYICGTESSSPSLTPYLSQLPCDPQHATKEYLYQVDSTTCTGYCPTINCTNMCPKSYIIYSSLNNTSDPIISQLGCNGVGGCGTNSDHNYQYAVSSPNQFPQTPSCGKWCLNIGGDCNGYFDPSVCQPNKFYCTRTECCQDNPGKCPP